MSLCSVLESELSTIFDNKKRDVLEAIEDACGPNEEVARAIANWDPNPSRAAEALEDAVIDEFATTKEWIEQADHEVALDEVRAEADRGDLVDLLQLLGIDELDLALSKNFTGEDRLRRLLTRPSTRLRILEVAMRICDEDEREEKRKNAEVAAVGTAPTLGNVVDLFAAPRTRR